jgi:hypothetical protein
MSNLKCNSDKFESNNNNDSCNYLVNDNDYLYKESVNRYSKRIQGISLETLHRILKPFIPSLITQQTLNNVSFVNTFRNYLKEADPLTFKKVIMPHFEQLYNNIICTDPKYMSDILQNLPERSQCYNKVINDHLGSLLNDKEDDLIVQLDEETKKYESWRESIPSDAIGIISKFISLKDMKSLLQLNSYWKIASYNNPSIWSHFVLKLGYVDKFDKLINETSITNPILNMIRKLEVYMGGSEAISQRLNLQAFITVTHVIFDVATTERDTTVNDIISISKQLPMLKTTSIELDSNHFQSTQMVEQLFTALKQITKIDLRITHSDDIDFILPYVQHVRNFCGWGNASILINIIKNIPTLEILTINPTFQESEMWYVQFFNELQALPKLHTLIYNAYRLTAGNCILHSLPSNICTLVISNIHMYVPRETEISILPHISSLSFETSFGEILGQNDYAIPNINSLMNKFPNVINLTVLIQVIINNIKRLSQGLKQLKHITFYANFCPKLTRLLYCNKYIDIIVRKKS